MDGEISPVAGSSEKSRTFKPQAERDAQEEIAYQIAEREAQIRGFINPNHVAYGIDPALKEKHARLLEDEIKELISLGATATKEEVMGVVRKHYSIRNPG